MSAFIIVTNGELAGQRFEIGEELTVGRENSDLTLPDSEASRHHAVLRMADGGVEVEDLHSLNGTWVDGERLERPVTLGDAATLRIGMTTLRVEAPAPAPPPTRMSAQPAAPPTEAHAPRTAPAPREEPAPRRAPSPALPAAPSPAAFATPAPRSRTQIATRLWVPAAMTFAIIIAATIALVVYFATR
jgi:FHA domain